MHVRVFTFKKLKFRDYFHSEQIARSPHVTLWGLCTLIYVLQNLLCVLVTSTYIEFEYVI